MMKKTITSYIQIPKGLILRNELSIFFTISLMASVILGAIQPTLISASVCDAAFDENDKGINYSSSRNKILTDSNLQEIVPSHQLDKQHRRPSRREKLKKYLSQTNGNKITARKMLEREERKNPSLPNAGNFSNRSRPKNLTFNPTSSVDPTFTADLAEGGYVSEIVPMPGDKFLVCGYFDKVNGISRRSIAILNADGSLDPTFNFTATSIGGRVVENVYNCAAQTDGKVVFSFFTRTDISSGIYTLARVNSDGSLDNSFAVGNVDGDFGSSISEVKLNPNGKIIVGGYFTTYNGVSRGSIAQLNSDGSIDTSFNTGTGFFGGVGSIGFQPDGKIICGGSFFSFNGMNANQLVRLNTNGSLDTTFNSGGTGLGMNSQFNSLTVAGDGKIYIGGRLDSYNGTTRIGIARLNANGSLDMSFTSPYTSTQDPFIIGMVLQSDGKILLTSRTFMPYDTDLIRLNTNGTIDSSFNTEFYGVYGDGIALQSNGQIWVGSYAFSRNGVTHAGVVRLQTDGSLDDSHAVVMTLQRDVYIERVAIQPDGKILIGGDGIIANGIFKGGVARLNPDGTLDNSLSMPFLDFNDNNRVDDLHVLPDGKILIAGDFVSGAVNEDILRLNSNGSLDATFNGPDNTLINEMAPLPDGKILIGGFSVQRLNADGSLDAAFPTITSPFGSQSFTIIRSLALQPDGKILVGWDDYTVKDDNRFSRYNSNGSVDASFGIITADTGGGEFDDIAIQSDGKIIVVGFFNGLIVSNGNPTTRFSNSIERLNADGSIDTGFAPNLATDLNLNLSEVVLLQPDGKILYVFDDRVVRLNSNGTIDSTFNSGSGADDDINDLALQADGKILVVGDFFTFDGQPRFSIARLLPNNPARTLFDFDGDRKTDISIFRPSVGEWWNLISSDGSNRAFQFGSNSDILTPGDFTGDGKTDIAFWRPSTGEWFILRSEDLSFFAFPFGANGDIPAPADYDGDGKTDPAVFRPSSGNWFIQRSSDGGTTIQQFGSSMDKPVPADYDGDGKADIAIYRASAGEWWLLRSSLGLVTVQFGGSTDKTVQGGDWTGDGKADIAFWRPSTGEWFVLRSEDFSFFAFPFGISTDIAAPGDYDGDGKFDPAVFRSSNSTWFIQYSSNGQSQIQQFGISSDRPVPNAFVYP